MMESTLWCSVADADPARLASPLRNRYFYGKLLDEHHFDLEQRYNNRKRWLINRLTAGVGVIDGLDVEVSADDRHLRVHPGVALDGWGREIIVPEPSRGVDPTVPTDDCGQPTGAPLRGRALVTLYICYHECEEEPAPVMVSTCEPEGACEHGVARERYHLRIVQGEPKRGPGVVSGRQCAAIFGPVPAGKTRLEVVCDTLSRLHPIPEDPCVPLAVIEIDPRGRIVRPIKECAPRPNVYSNAVLLDLILCLAARVDDCCGDQVVRMLEKVSGDNQIGRPRQNLDNPLVVKVTEGGQPVPAGEVVTFEISSGGGSLGNNPLALANAFDVQTAANGQARLDIWRLGPVAGVQSVRAKIAAGMPSQVLFQATAVEEQVNLPVILRSWPANAFVFQTQSRDPVIQEETRRFLASPRIELTFNFKMRQPQLDPPHDWLRAFYVMNVQGVTVMPINLVYAGPGAPPVPGEFTEVWNLERADRAMVVMNEAFGLRAVAGAGAGAGGGAGVAAGAGGHAVLGRDAVELAVLGFGERVPVAVAPHSSDIKILVLVKAELGNIVKAVAPPLLLDADFPGAQLTDARFDEIWNLAGQQVFPQAVWDALVDTGARFPSGEHAEGGRGKIWFQLSK